MIVMPKQTIKDATKAIRDARKLVLVGTDPFCWELKNTAGDGKHVLVYEEDREDVVCITCEAEHHQNRCWARTRVLADLAQRFGPDVKPEAVEEPEPTPEPETPSEAIGGLSWREVFREYHAGLREKGNHA